MLAAPVPSPHAAAVPALPGHEAEHDHWHVYGRRRRDVRANAALADRRTTELQLLLSPPLPIRLPIRRQVHDVQGAVGAPAAPPSAWTWPVAHLGHDVQKGWRETLALRMKGPNKPLGDVVEGLSRPTIDIVAFPGDQKLDPPSSLPPRDDLLDVLAVLQQRPFSAPPGPAAVLVGFREIPIFLSLNNWRSACHEGVEGWGGGVMRHINREVPSCAPQRPIAPDGGAAHRTHTVARPSPPGA